MMGTNSSGSVQNLNEGRSEALRALLSSIDQDNGQDRSGLSSEQARLIRDTLQNMLGDTESNNNQVNTNRTGELLNDEGLPIIEITEPVEEISTSMSRLVKPSQEEEELIEEPDFIPVSSLPSEQRAKILQQRDQILDLLEQEEGVQAKRIAEREVQDKREELEQRRAAAKAELDRLHAAKEMQRAMGKALLRTATESSIGDESNQASTSSQAESSAAKGQKSVAFAGTDLESSNYTNGASLSISPDVGDVSIAPIKGRRFKPMDRSAINKQPMKTEVVERIPGMKPKTLQVFERDSDDESERNSSPASDESDSRTMHNGSAEEDDGLQSDDPLDDEYDYSGAQHQREIALEYLSLKDKIGSDITKAMVSDVDQDEWDRPEVPLNATLSSNPPKSRISKFKSSRFATARSNPTTPSSTSVGANLIPVEQVGAVKLALRFGKLEDNGLVGDNYNSEDEDSRGMLDLLRSGQIADAKSNTPEASSSVSVASKSIMSDIRERRTMGESTPQMNSTRSSPKLLPTDIPETHHTADERSPTLLDGPRLKATSKDAVPLTTSLLYTDAMVIESPSYSNFPPSLVSADKNSSVERVMATDVLEARRPTSLPKQGSVPDRDKKVSKVSKFKATRHSEP